MTDQPLRVILAVQDPEVRNEMRRVLSEMAEVGFVAEVETAATLDCLVDAKDTDVAVIDLGSRRLDALAIARRVAADGGRPRIVVTSQHNDSRYVTRALHAGVTGFVLTDRAYEDLAPAVRGAALNRHFISPGVAGIEAEAEAR